MLEKVSTNDHGVALDGYDVVAYQEGTAKIGVEQYSHDWGGATFRFSNKLNQDTFHDNPQHYIPQYGGHCAFGMGFGKSVHADPKVFTLVNGKVYLNASPMARRCWRWFGNIEKADTKWQNAQELETKAE